MKMDKCEKKDCEGYLKKENIYPCCNCFRNVYCAKDYYVPKKTVSSEHKVQGGKDAR